MYINICIFIFIFAYVYIYTYICTYTIHIIFPFWFAMPYIYMYIYYIHYIPALVRHVTHGDTYWRWQEEEESFGSMKRRIFVKSGTNVSAAEKERLVKEKNEIVARTLRKFYYVWYMSACVHVFLHIYVYEYTHINIYTHEYIYTCFIHIYVSEQTCIKKEMCMYICMHIYTYIYTYTLEFYICTYICI